MKKLVASVIALGCVTYGGTVAYLSYYDHNTAPTLGQKSPTQQNPVAREVFAVFQEARCDYCHTRGAHLPFYSQLPVAKQLMSRDVEQGLRHFRMEPVLAALQKGDIPSEEQLARIELVVRNNTMPPLLYLLMHWHARLSATEREAILKWVGQMRREHYASSDVVKRFAEEPLRPVPQSLPVDQKKVALGQRLFFDKKLSGDGTLNCASCHSLQNGGVDGLTTATGIKGQKGPINTPTVFNAVFNVLQFWDGRAHDLAEQAKGPVMNPIEMGALDWDQVTSRLKQDPSYVSAFEGIFGQDQINADTIASCIAEYEKTLITPDSRFDQYLKGDDTALNEQEKRGYALFKSVGCASCHNGPAVGGGAFEIMGLEQDYFASRKQTDADNGRYNVTHSALDMHRFKVPTLRNIALTAPYFHDGSRKTLEEAVRDMAKNQTTAGAGLSDKDVADIVAFLKTLTGKYQQELLKHNVAH